jgi:hypothetical protein
LPYSLRDRGRITAQVPAGTQPAADPAPARG